jgi:hypothetical protein
VTFFAEATQTERPSPGSIESAIGASCPATL